MTEPEDKPNNAKPDEDGPQPIKIFPRNLTARAAYLVEGNPATSRPESGVDNCFPGLEIDQRNLDQRFFPGLLFEYQRDDGAILADIELRSHQLTSGLAKADLSPSRPLFLWALYGKTSVADKEPSLFGFHQARGPEVWRRVHDLLPGRIAIAFGPRPDFLSSNGPNFSAQLLTALDEAYKAQADVDKFRVTRGVNGLLTSAVFSDERALYIDPESGLIDVDTFAPGELTKSLCAPWVFDFRDCICFYWASSKPDVVMGDGKPDLNFLRNRDAPPTDAPPSPVYSEWLNQMLGHGPMISGAWKRLPVVLNDREVFDDLPGDRPLQGLSDAFNRIPEANLLDALEAFNELKYLATVEHALIVEYLFAYYSLNVPCKPPGPTETKPVVSVAADELFKVAIDEMRHFFWVNQLIRLLGSQLPVPQQPVTARAKIIGQTPDAREQPGRKKIPGFKYLDKKFSLRPLTPDVLREFIEIEANSRNIDDNNRSFGMYVHLLASFLRRLPSLANREHLIELTKLLIDEGDDHGGVFNKIEAAFNGINQEVYLRPLRSDDGSYGRENQDLLKLGDVYYQELLRMIHISYSLGPDAGGELIAKAVQQMEKLHDVGRQLACVNIGLRFTEPKTQDIRATLEQRGPLAALNMSQQRTRTGLLAVQAAGDPQIKQMAQRHLEETNGVYEKYKEIAKKSEQRRKDGR